MELIDGKKIADAVKQEIASEVAEMVAGPIDSRPTFIG